MFNLKKLFSGIYNPNRNAIIELLKTDKQAMQEFENLYQKRYLDKQSDNLFEISAKQAKNLQQKNSNYISDYDRGRAKEMADYIVKTLIARTPVWTYKRNQKPVSLPAYNTKDSLTIEEINTLPASIRPQLTSSLMAMDIGEPSYETLLETYIHFLKETDEKKAQQIYNHFRQGLDILDLDPVIYEILGQNPNSIGNWLPEITTATEEQNFFKIPETTIIKVPMTLLQLTRKEYFELNDTTFYILNNFCNKIFNLEAKGNYFVKTGTYSSKFDFRNTHVFGKEIKDLGEYLMYMHFQAISMAHYDLSGRNQPVIYGVSTTNEWCVREFIKDKDNWGTIYNGMPLHTEYRVFVDFDNTQVLTIHPYWDPEVMKPHFEKYEDNAKYEHDLYIYSANEENIMSRYEQNKTLVAQKIQELLQTKKINLNGQWSIDIMQNNDEFWLIDMATAQTSAYYKHVPEALRRPYSIKEEPWIPQNLLSAASLHIK